MKKKLIVIIFLIMIILAALGMIYTNNHFKVRNTYFNIPDGFQAINNENYVNLTNGTDYICIIKDNKNEDINKSIRNYVETRQKNNITVEITNFTINEVDVFKSNEYNSNVNYYWFIKNNQMYKMFSLDSNNNTDKLVQDEIKTMDVFFF